MSDSNRVEFYREYQPGQPSHGDYLAIETDTQDYYRQQGRGQVQGRAAAIAGDPSSVCTTGIGLEFLAEKCVRVARADVPLEWRRHINMDHDGDRFEDGGEPLEEAPAWLDGKARAAAADALGYWPLPDDLIAMVEANEGVPDADLAGRLDAAEQAFDTAGGRGVELADPIDSCRVALAVREAQAKAREEAARPPRRYRATFDPQAWINDYALSVDPRGETTWDCTAFVTSPPDHLDGFGEAAVLAAIEADGFFLDRDDVIKDDPAAPEWVREWAGPFTITVDVEEAN